MPRKRFRRPVRGAGRVVCSVPVNCWGDAQIMLTRSASQPDCAEELWRFRGASPALVWVRTARVEFGVREPPRRRQYAERTQWQPGSSRLRTAIEISAVGYRDQRQTQIVERFMASGETDGEVCQ
jgi:hypothetical protein